MLFRGFHKLKKQNRNWWVPNLWRIVILFSILSALCLGVTSWLVTRSMQSLFLTLGALLLLISVALGAFSLFSFNIFRRKMGHFNSQSEASFVFALAIGLYLLVVGVIFFVTSYILLQIFQLPQPIVWTMVGIELSLFALIGYSGLTKLRQYAYTQNF